MNDPRIGTSYEEMPELDSVAHVDFEEAPDYYEEADDRRAWMVDAAHDVLMEAGILQTAGFLFQQLDCLGEELFWQWVERRINHAGFGTYNSDSYFEVYPPAEIDSRFDSMTRDELLAARDDEALSGDELELVNDLLEADPDVDRDAGILDAVEAVADDIASLSEAFDADDETHHRLAGAAATLADAVAELRVRMGVTR